MQKESVDTCDCHARAESKLAVWVYCCVANAQTTTVNRCQRRKARRNTNGRSDGRGCSGYTRRKAVETNSLESYIHVGGFFLSSTIAIRLFVAHLGAQAATSHHIMTAVTGLVNHLVNPIHCSPDVHCATPYRRVVGVCIFSNVWPPLVTAQKGIALLILPDVSAGYPSIFLPASLAQQPQKIAAGQHMIWTVGQDFRIWA